MTRRSIPHKPLAPSVPPGGEAGHPKDGAAEGGPSLPPGLPGGAPPEGPRPWMVHTPGRGVRAGWPPLPEGVDLHAVAGELIRDLIRRDPALWARVQGDLTLRRAFGFEDE
jgi:hypothetical protein